MQDTTILLRQIKEEPVPAPAISDVGEETKYPTTFASATVVTKATKVTQAKQATPASHTCSYNIRI